MMDLSTRFVRTGSKLSSFSFSFMFDLCLMLSTDLSSSVLQISEKDLHILKKLGQGASSVVSEGLRLASAAHMAAPVTKKDSDCWSTRTVDNEFVTCVCRCTRGFMPWRTSL